ncbi:hypothetical protein A2833_03150 [Candidatus Azambacteria bacterium RIFCSPHIGHO2_01_FULL_44_55]|uniref:50S ribosomal protein L28 n=1 Tax=Candidatus Azambacteria bacterium RIFCSPLOWO2_02_FULL_44_14 TaxID=1797306 RepID=A0A1F5CBE2_9BACT|nr:MAG: hypothetical protein A3A18_02465 [Candidatus Azambacteria bacterium RIFCSPLOWO2_01_FULL_44_84]OGD32727.1 MAG: hypothetical protein A3C78_01880 [Candidatus Azambacteria bacterium RIFCSPHIGHO2_02_FULL_45_18]OGD40180.1 MAG: hypothetical protein A3I30_02845 [Candidatus Azambacteria bacterium RIFCSPLOWO2_02_FULL_44_14]OGD41712.1 MAG: hypothetical protein A2833_03150 [Candidatus Azambacteria bacterium RIFCSPHIGHO2_01_FULL_44_55]OGD50069.1 MAG: hypothetical protein A2608_03405 [Candidatus Azam
MSRVCAICAKTSTLITPRNKLRGKYNPAPKVRKYPNLQWVHLPARQSLGVGGASGKRVKACVTCIKTMHKTRV